MRTFYILSGFFILIFCCAIPLPHHFKEYQVQRQGSLVNVQLTDVPRSIGCKIRYQAKFTYEGKGYSKQVPCNFDESHKVGDVIKLKHLEGSDIFLFAQENVIKEFVAFGFLGVFGLSMIVYGWSKKPTYGK